MANIGCLGDIPFKVSSDLVQTFSNAKMSGSAKYGTHFRRAGDALIEFVGNNPDKFSFDMELSAFLGVDPIQLIDKLTQYRREGRTLPLVIGEKSYGKYRWIILSSEVKIGATDHKGNVLSATVSISLQEYSRS